MRIVILAGLSFLLAGCENLNGLYSDAPSQPQTVALQAQRPAPGEMALLPQSLPVYDATDAVDTGLQSSRDKTAAIRYKEEIPLQ